MVDEILNGDADPTIKELLKHLTKTVAQLQSTIEKQTAQIEKLNAVIEQKDSELAELRRMLFGRKSENMPPMSREVKKTRKSKTASDADKTQAKRKRKLVG